MFNIPQLEKAKPPQTLSDHYARIKDVEVVESLSAHLADCVDQHTYGNDSTFR